MCSNSKSLLPLLDLASLVCTWQVPTLASIMRVKGTCGKNTVKACRRSTKQRGIERVLCLVALPREDNKFQPGRGEVALQV